MVWIAAAGLLVIGAASASFAEKSLRPGGHSPASYAAHVLLILSAVVTVAVTLLAASGQADRREPHGGARCRSFNRNQWNNLPEEPPRLECR